MAEHAILTVAKHEDNELTVGTPLTIIRTETVLSRLPIHTLAKKGNVQIRITRKNAQGAVDLYWHVAPNAVFGVPRHLAYKLDTIVIHQCLHALGRPLPKVLRLGSMTQLCHDLDVVVGGSGKASLKQAFLQNAATFITAKLHYRALDGTERILEAGFTRYSVVFTGERLPDGRKADAVYLVLNEPYWEVLNHAPTRPLNYDYLKALAPAAQRWYEILSYKFFTAIKYQHPHAKLLYSDYCTFAAQQRYLDYDHVKKQMYKLHKPHMVSTYLASVRYEATRDEAGAPDWCMYYVPGAKAHAEYAAFNTRTQRHAARAPRPALESGEDVPLSPPSAPPVVADSLTTDAHALVQYFHQRFHGTPDVTPSAKALAQARDLITRYGVDQARHVVDFSLTAAPATAYRPQTFSGILQYTAQARADYARAQQRVAAEAQAREERRRAQTEEAQRAQYAAYRAERLAQLRASLAPDELAALEADAAARFERAHTSPFGREHLRRRALDAAVAASGQVLPFAAWQLHQTPKEDG